MIAACTNIRGLYLPEINTRVCVKALEIVAIAHTYRVDQSRVKLASGLNTGVNRALAHLHGP